jgi:hypothetical protein
MRPLGNDGVKVGHLTSADNSTTTQRTDSSALCMTVVVEPKRKRTPDSVQPNKIFVVGTLQILVAWSIRISEKCSMIAPSAGPLRRDGPISERQTTATM